MRHLAPRAALDMSEADLYFIEERAACLLSEVGLEVPLADALRRLADFPEARVRGERVYFEDSYVLEALRCLRHPLPPNEDWHLNVHAGGGALNMLGEGSISPRPATAADLLRCFRVCDRLGLGGDPPVVPHDVPMPLCEVALYKLAWQHTRAFSGRDIGSAAVGEYVFEMAQVADKPFSLPLYMISPLRVNAENLALALHFADRLPAVSVSTMPMPGATAPLLAPGYLAQALAEAFGGYTIASLLLPQARISFGFKLLAFDPYANALGCGSPESLLQGQLEVALLARYGKRPGHNFWSMAGAADAQAAAERMAGVLLGALAGVRSFGVAGRLQGEGFSLQQLLIDLEIAAHVERVLRGQLWQEPDDWLEETRQALSERTFLGSDATAALYRQETWRSRLFDRFTLANRAALGLPDLRGRLRDRLAELDQEAEEPAYLSPAANAELERIYAMAREEL